MKNMGCQVRFKERLYPYHPTSLKVMLGEAHQNFAVLYKFHSAHLLK